MNNAPAAETNATNQAIVGIVQHPEQGLVNQGKLLDNMGKLINNEEKVLVNMDKLLGNQKETSVQVRTLLEIQKKQIGLAAVIKETIVDIVGSVRLVENRVGLVASAGSELMIRGGIVQNELVNLGVHMERVEDHLAYGPCRRPLPTSYFGGT